jgi:hypothetical protein
MRHLAVFLLGFAISACKNERTSPIVPAPDPPASSMIIADASVPDADSEDSGTNLSACNHVRPFVFRRNSPPFVVPSPYDTFTPCDLLRAIHSDYDPKTGQSAAAGGTQAIDVTTTWSVSGRTLLAVLYYSGPDAEMDMVYGQVRVAVHVAVLEKQDGKLVLVGKPKDPWRPEEKPDEIIALFNGRAEFDPTDYFFMPGERMLAIKTPWSMGMSGYWDHLTLYRLADNSIDQVFEHELQTTGTASGLPDRDIVRSEISFHAQEGKPNEIRIVNTEEMCKIDYDAPGEPTVCQKATIVGKEKWQFKRREYKRVEGKTQPLPRILRSR